MTGLKFELDIDAEIQKLGLPPAKPANSANPCSTLIFDIPSRYSILIESQINIAPGDLELQFIIHERSAIMEFDGGMDRNTATDRAFERVIGPLESKEIVSVENLPLTQIRTLCEAKSVFGGNIL